MANKGSKRLRCGNFSVDEKAMIVEFAQEHSAVIESKTSEPNMFKRKRKLWENLAEKMRSAGHIRSPTKLRDMYFRLKQSSKAKISKYNREKRKTGGGEGPSGDDAPSELDWAIHDVCPIDFEDDISKFDSDYIQEIPPTPAVLPSESPTIRLPDSPTNFYGLIDPISGNITQAPSSPRLTSTDPIVFPSASSPPKTRKFLKSKRPMSAYEHEMLELNRKHLEARMKNEKLVAQKELEILEIKKQVELAKLEYVKTWVEEKKF